MAEKEELPDINCFIHSVSPLKRSSGTEYINCDIQTESAVVKCVCFSPEKGKTLEAVALQKSPVRIKKYNISTQYGRQDIVIDKKTCLIPTTVAFDYTSLDKNISIASLSEVASDQLVAIKACVTHLSPTQSVVLQGGPVRKQQCYLSDPSGFMKLILWGSHTDTLEDDARYLFKKVRVRVSRDERYLNTPKKEDDCTITPAESFTESLPAVEVVSTIKELTANILGVTNATKSQCCCSCGKKVIMKGRLAYCESCKMSQKATRCKSQWYLRVYAESVGHPEEKVRLSVFNDVVKKFQILCGLAEDMSESELVEGIFMLDSVAISYDSQRNKLIDVEVIDI